MNLYKDHGTKLIGAVGTVAGLVQSLDPALLATVLGPKGFGYVATALSIWTILRGVQNTQSQPPAQPQVPVK